MYRKRQYRKKPYIRKKKVYTKRKYVPRNRGWLNKVYMFRQVHDLGVITASTSELDGAFKFLLSDLDQFSSFTALYDQYKICKIVLKFYPNANVAQVTAPGTHVYGNILTAIDHDDATTVSLANIRQYSTCKEYPFYKSFTRVIVPHVAVAAYTSGAFNNYANMTNQWIDCNSPNVEHYGLKYVVPATGTTQTDLPQWTVVGYYYIAFKNVR